MAPSQFLNFSLSLQLTAGSQLSFGQASKLVRD